MKVVYTDSAKEYIKDKKIDNVYIKPVLTGSRCCGIRGVRIDIKSHVKDDKEYIKDYFDGINTNYHPAINQFLKSSTEILITVVGIGNMKTLVSQTEFSSVKLD